MMGSFAFGVSARHAVPAMLKEQLPMTRLCPAPRETPVIALQQL